MATDVDILTARKNLWSALQAMREADEANLRAAVTAKNAEAAAVAARQRVTEARTRLIQLAESKPAEQPVLVVEVHPSQVGTYNHPAPATGPIPNLRGKRVHTS